MRPTLLALLALCIVPADGAARRIPMERVVESLVADLGDERYQVRERATTVLRTIGLPARPFLEAAARSDDPEIRVRARDILRDVDLGVTPEWPAELVLLARHFDQQPRHIRYESLRQIASLGAPAVPFLLLRLRKDDQGDADYALNFIKTMKDPRVPDIIMTLVKEPNNDRLAQILAWAISQRDSATDQFADLLERRLPGDLAKKVADPATEKLAAVLKDKPRAAAAAAEAAAKAHPDDIRPLYIQALAFLALGQPEKAADIRQRALAAHPQSARAHFLAAWMLTDLGRYRFAVPEWRKVIDITPATSVLNAIANVALHRIYSENGLYELAADHLAKAVENAAQTAGQNPLPKAMVQGVHAEIGRLRNYAARYPQQNVVVEDRIPEEEVGVDVAIEAQDGSTDELRAALSTASLHLQLVAGSPPLRLPDATSLSFRYDRKKKALDVLLRGKPACEPVPFRPPGDKARFAVHCADASYLFRIRPDGACEQLARYTKNYRLRLTLGPRLRICTSYRLSLSGRTYDWDKAKEGIVLDILPERLRLTIDAISPAGPRMVRRTLTFSEPDLVARFVQQKSSGKAR